MRAAFILEATKPCGAKYRLEFSLGIIFLGWLGAIGL